jgi:hypothetical protein
VKIRAGEANNRKKAFELHTSRGVFTYPYAKLELQPGADNRIREVYPEPETGNEAFTYRLESGDEDTVHLDVVLEYNQDPSYLNELLLHRLTVEARRAVEESGVSKRELTRRLATSASQLYRLLDPGNPHKSVGQLLALLHLLGRKVDLVVSTGESSARAKPAARPRRVRRSRSTA